MSLETDFIVIGSGIAGLRAAIEIAQSGARVTVLTKDRTDESNTEYAQGGIAVALSDEDEVALHEEDTLNAGAGLCDERWRVHSIIQKEIDIAASETVKFHAEAKVINDA